MSDDAAEVHALVDRLRGGDAEALAPLLAHYRRQVMRAAVFRLDPRLRDQLGALDLAGAVERTARDRLPEFQSAAVPFFIWLRGLLFEHIEAIHQQRLGGRAGDVLRDDLLATSAPKLAEFVAHTLLPLFVPRRDEAIAELTEHFARLSHLERELIALRMYEAWDEPEANAILSITPEDASAPYARGLESYRVAAAITQKYWEPRDDD